MIAVDIKDKAGNPILGRKATYRISPYAIKTACAKSNDTAQAVHRVSDCAKNAQRR